MNDLTRCTQSAYISLALASCLENTQFDFSGSPKYEELVKKDEKSRGLLGKRLQSKAEDKKGNDNG